MSNNHINLDFTRQVWRQRIDDYLASHGLGFNTYLAREERLDLIARLDLLPEQELRRIGLDGRQDILPFAFRDLLAA
ncbi:hypothetical protein SAMN05421688_0414 [Poseidonocella pacifica]|uniref:Uncharacterized protein n=1 Tax=Poseidonocella pacifica TaxID=871651 RepID=A0A1I0V940_9RHOB|nr:hypothetical protein [Poseidonocella pacifica]SFA72762.1 hypothetical protein SAMN05421688_0414 [Poseidonocella pacifica]